MLGSCAGQCPAVPVLYRLVSVMTELLAHQAAAVVKQALKACQTCCRAAVAAVVAQSQGALKAEGGVQQLWDATLALQQQAGALLASHANAGVRLQAAKFIEHLLVKEAEAQLLQ
eukprot:jgi/Astpho2/3600/Aster-06894